MREIELPAEMEERLRADTRRAAQRGGGDEGGAEPRPGDLYALPATAEHAVEWCVAARRGGELLAVAADPDPQVGSGDVEVPEDEPGGPLVLRCRCAAWVPAATFGAAPRTGRLELRWAEAAHQRRRQVETGTAHGTPLERETDADPAYQDRAEELAAARDALLRHAADLEHRSQRRRFRRPGPWRSPAWRAIAAVLLVALVGAVWWGSGLARRVAELSGPRLVEPNGPEIRLGSTERGETEIQLPGAPAELAIPLVAAGTLPAADLYRLTLLDADNEEIWARQFEIAPHELKYLTIPRRLVPPGIYLLRIEDATSEPPGLLDEEVLRILPED